MHSSLYALSNQVALLCGITDHQVIRSIRSNLETIFLKERITNPTPRVEVSPVASLTFTAIPTARSKYSATFSKSSSVKPLLVKAGVPVATKKCEH